MPCFPKKVARSLCAFVVSIALIASFCPVAAWASDVAPIDVARSLIEQLPAPTEVQESDGTAIQQARSAYDALPESERQLLDTETNRAALNTTQSYGRVLELAEAGYAVLHAVDNDTPLADGVYTTNVTNSWDRGKSASKQDRDWVAAAVRVENGKAHVLLRVNSSTYSYVRASAVTCQRRASSASGESDFLFPVSLGKKMTFLAYSQTMAAEIAYNLTVSVPASAKPDAALGSSLDPCVAQSGGEQGGGEAGTQDLAPIVNTDAATGAHTVEKGTFAYPEDIPAYMFRFVAPLQVTSDGVHMTLRGTLKTAKSYTHLFVGTIDGTDGVSLEDGVADGRFIEAEEGTDAKGRETTSFTFPLATLDANIDLCLYSGKNHHWVDVTREGYSFAVDSGKLQWAPTDAEKAQLADAIACMEALPARNTIVPDNPEHKAAVAKVRTAFDALNRWQQAQVPARLKLLLEWDESMFELGFNTEQLPMGMVGRAYDGAVYVSGKNGEQGKSIEVVKGELPDGFTLQMDDAGLWANFAGTPVRNGTWTFTVRVSNGVDTPVDKEFTIHVGYAPVVLTKALPAAVQGRAYSAALEANAYPDATWRIVGGRLPAGLVFADGGEASNAARITGVPSEPGAFPVTFECDNFANGVEMLQLTLVVSAAAGQPETQGAAAQDNAAKDAVINVKTVGAKQVKKALKAAGNVNAKTVTLGSKVKSIKKGAFAKTKLKVLRVKTKKLTKKSVKGCLKGSKVKRVEVSFGSKAASKKLAKKYKKLFVKKNSGRKVSVFAAQR